MSSKNKNRKLFDAAGAVFVMAMYPCVIAFSLGMAQAEPAASSTAAYASAREVPLTASGMGTEVPEGIPASEAPGKEPENMDYDGLTQQTESLDTEGQAETETETETKSVRERAELNARIKHLADYASGEETNPDYQKIGYVYTEEMYYKLTGATELPDDWTDRMDPLMRGIITEEDEFVETMQTDDGAAQEQWLPAAVNTALYQTAALDGTTPEQAVAAVQAAQRKLGYPYSQAMRDSGIAYDCSSMVYWSYLEAGVNIDPVDGHTAASIARYLESMGRGISGGDLRPGDLIFYSYKNNGRYKNISHVAMVAGDGMMVHASSSKKMVVMTRVTLNRAVAVARPVPDGTPETYEIPENAGDTIEDAKGSTQEPSQETDMSQYGPGMTQGAGRRECGGGRRTFGWGGGYGPGNCGGCGKRLARDHHGDAPGPVHPGVLCVQA